MTDIADRLDRDYPPAWRPDQGDKLVGTVVSVDLFEGEYGQYPILTVDTDNGTVAVHAFHTVLKNELAKKAPAAGDRIGIKYVGKSEKGYEAYRVVMETTRQVNWTEIAEDAASELGHSDVPPASRDDYGPDESPF